jgi:uncharacterized membrane protein (Fun14 family)
MIQIEIIGWVWLGIIVGMLIGIVLSSLMGASKFGDLRADNLKLKFIAESLKEEIFRLENQVKPKPRKKRIQAKSIKIGE